jgi:hypothetical protein
MVFGCCRPSFDAAAVRWVSHVHPNAHGWVRLCDMITTIVCLCVELPVGLDCYR